MSIAENIQMLRKKNNLSQEELAVILNVSRQAVGKWENGTAYPDLERLIQLSNRFKISLDRLVKEAENCDLDVKNKENPDKCHLIKFLLRAKNMNCFLYLFKSSFVIYLVFINLIIQ